MQNVLELQNLPVTMDEPMGADFLGSLLSNHCTDVASAE